MTIEQLTERLNSIKGNSPVANARRVAIMNMIVRLMAGGGNG